MLEKNNSNKLSRINKWFPTLLNKTFLKKKENIIIIFLIIILGLFIYLISLNGLLVWDEVVYLSNARGKIGFSNYVEDFRFPLLSTIIGGIWLVTGESIIIAQFFMILTSLITIIIFYYISNHFLSKNLSIISTILFGLSQQFLNWGFRIYTDILGVCLFLGCFLCLIKNFDIKAKDNIVNITTFKNKNSILLVSAGILSGLAFSARLSTIVASIGLSLFLICDKEYIKNITLFCSGFIISIIPWIINGLLVHSNPIYFITAQSSAIIEYTSKQSPLILLQYLFKEYTFSLIFILFNILYFTNNFKEKKFKLKILIVMFCLLIQLSFYLVYVNLKLSRYILEMSPFIVLLIMLGAQAIMLKLLSEKKDKIKQTKLSFLNYLNKIFDIQKHNIKRTITIILIIISLSILIPSGIGFHNLKENTRCTSHGAVVKSITFLESYSQPNQTVVSSIWPYHGYYLNLEPYSPWSDDLNEFFKAYNESLKYFIFSNSFGIPYLGNTTHENVFKMAEFVDSCGWDITIYKVVK
jgi:hypothetical protein